MGLAPHHASIDDVMTESKLPVGALFERLLPLAASGQLAPQHWLKLVRVATYDARMYLYDTQQRRSRLVDLARKLQHWSLGQLHLQRYLQGQ
jgi:hypothetical protein